MKVAMNVDDSSFQGACEAVISRVSRGTKIAAQEGGNAILNVAKAWCPRYTGTLMNSGECKVDGDYKRGFSATVSFGNGDGVNPTTGQHPRDYAAAVHEGYAVNPVTGERSEYNSGVPKFLEHSVRQFEATWLYRVAYKYWADSLKAFESTQVSYAQDRSEFMYSQGMTGQSGVEWSPGSFTITAATTDELGGFNPAQVTAMTTLHMGITKASPVMPSEGALGLYYKQNQSSISAALQYATLSSLTTLTENEKELIYSASEYTKALAAAWSKAGSNWTDDF